MDNNIENLIKRIIVENSHKITCESYPETCESNPTYQRLNLYIRNIRIHGYISEKPIKKRIYVDDIYFSTLIVSVSDEEIWRSNDKNDYDFMFDCYKNRNKIESAKTEFEILKEAYAQK